MMQFTNDMFGSSVAEQVEYETSMATALGMGDGTPGFVVNGNTGMAYSMSQIANDSTTQANTSVEFSAKYLPSNGYEGNKCVQFAYIIRVTNTGIGSSILQWIPYLQGTFSGTWNVTAMAFFIQRIPTMDSDAFLCLLPQGNALAGEDLVDVRLHRLHDLWVSAPKEEKQVLLDLIIKRLVALNWSVQEAESWLRKRGLDSRRQVTLGDLTDAKQLMLDAPDDNKPVIKVQEESPVVVENTPPMTTSAAKAPVNEIKGRFMGLLR